MDADGVKRQRFMLKGANGNNSDGGGGGGGVSGPIRAVVLEGGSRRDPHRLVDEVYHKP